MHLVFRRWPLVLLGCALVATATACSQREERADPRATAATEFVAPVPDATRDVAIVTIRDMGEIRVELFADRAPNTVGAFKQLAGDAFYDGTTFHRIIPGSVIQGGDPNSRNRDPRDDGDGGADFQLKAEFNDVDHRRGIVSMARATGADSARGQFFVCLTDRPELNGAYTAFGRVIAGMDVVDRIAAVPRDEFGRRGKPDRPLEDVVIESVRIVSADAASTPAR
jgi:cyclophilin family peptidyl-prolyl cis-trans isomerase